MILRSTLTIHAALLASLFCGLTFAAGPKYTDPGSVDADFAYQGEYSGTLDDGQKLGIQVIALGEGKFQGVGFIGGLPGDGWTGEDRIRAEGELKEDAIRFETDNGSAIVKNGAVTVYDADGYRVCELAKVERKSPTLGKAAPENAVVLFDGSEASLKNWKNGQMTEDGLLMQGTQSNRMFGDHKIHFEFRLAYQPADRGQGRSNSGIYLQGRYEVQILDSFGLDGKQNECGGIYSVAEPDVNMCFPPLSWQTYDIDYKAAQYDDAGKIAENPRITVRHNGVVIHDDVELPGNRSTTAAPVKPGPEGGPIFLQNHGCPLRYRNIWVVEE